MQHKHAIVMGGSRRGYGPRRVLSERFEQVTLMERDALPTAAENRRGVPQGRHTHGLLASGRRILDQLFPGISDELIQAGAVAGNIAGKGRWFNEGGRLMQFESGLQALAMSRLFLEHALRNRIRSLPNVRVRDACHIEGLVLSDDKRRVTGATVAGENTSAR